MNNPAIAAWPTNANNTHGDKPDQLHGGNWRKTVSDLRIPYSKYKTTHIVPHDRANENDCQTKGGK